MIDVEKAIQAGKALKEAKEKKEADEAESKRLKALKEREEEIAKLRLAAHGVVIRIDESIANYTSYGSTKVELYGCPRVVTRNDIKVDGPDAPELWQYIAAECAEQGIKTKVLYNSYEDNNINYETGHGDYFTTFYAYLGIDLEDYKL
jgi:hypothetical protein